MQKQRVKLSTIIICFVCLVVLLSLLITELLISNTVNENIRKNEEEKALILARTVSKSNIVIDGLKQNDDSDSIQIYTKDIKSATEVMFVVVMDMKGIRKSHPNTDKIGKHFVGGDEKDVMKGKEYISRSIGTLGESLRAFTPVYDENHTQIGAVAVGISLDNLEKTLNQSRQNFITGTIIGIMVGIVGAILLARYIKKILLGLEPLAIAKILEERSTMLQSVHEGIVAVDNNSTITLVNKSALQIFQKAGILNQEPVGMKIYDFMPSSKLDRVLETGKPELDEEQNINGVSILVNKVPLVVNGQVVGTISTFRDKTEVNQLAEQLTGVKTYAEALRAQSHEFMNRLHVILGMVRMKFYDELADFIHKIVDHRNLELEVITKNIKDPALAGFLMGKLSYAREEKVELLIINEPVIPEPQNSKITHELVTIIGNLIDNAIEALSVCTEKTIEVNLRFSDNRLIIKVSDSGPGITDEMLERILEKGYSTKGQNRGYGLYLVSESIKSLGGILHIEPNPDSGMKFIVEIPYEAKEEKND
jgi:two-component system, CitB family, sensor histidine kinase MalK